MDTEHQCGTVGSQVAGYHFNNNPGIDGNVQVRKRLCVCASSLTLSPIQTNCLEFLPT